MSVSVAPLISFCETLGYKFVRFTWKRRWMFGWRVQIKPEIACNRDRITIEFFFIWCPMDPDIGYRRWSLIAAIRYVNLFNTSISDIASSLLLLLLLLKLASISYWNLYCLSGWDAKKNEKAFSVVILLRAQQSKCYYMIYNNIFWYWYRINYVSVYQSIR